MREVGSWKREDLSPGQVHGTKLLMSLLLSFLGKGGASLTLWPELRNQEGEKRHCQRAEKNV